MTFWAPTSLNQIVGNKESLELLRAILADRDRAPLAYCLEGPHGVGKSTIAKLFLRQFFPEERVADIQPDRFGQTINQEDLAEYPCMIWDHAERLTKEQADNLAAFMDRSDFKTVLVFTSHDYTRIPQAIRARTLRVPCAKPSQSDLTGLLGSICSAHGLNFELDALNLIATRTQGVPSRAIIALHAVSLLGNITSETVAKLQISIEEQALQLLTRVALDQNPLEYVAEVKDQYPTEEMIDALFTTYAQIVYDKSSVAILSKLSNYKRVGEIFIKWKSCPTPPSASLFILTRELMDSNCPETLAPEPAAPAVPQTQRARPITGAELDQLLLEASATGDPTIR